MNSYLDMDADNYYKVEKNSRKEKEKKSVLLIEEGYKEPTWEPDSNLYKEWV